MHSAYEVMRTDDTVVGAVCWYRVTDGRYSGADEFERPYDAGPWVCCNALPVVRTTPKGAWVEDLGGGLRFVLRGARKRYACPTVAEAWASWRARKLRQQQILQHKLHHVQQVLGRVVWVEHDTLAQ